MRLAPALKFLIVKPIQMGSILSYRRKTVHAFPAQTWKCSFLDIPDLSRPRRNNVNTSITVHNPIRTLRARLLIQHAVLDFLVDQP